MTKFNDIYEIAADNHGLITSMQAKSVGLSNNELVQYAKRGRVEKVGYGVYKLTRWVPEENDTYALAVKIAGNGAVLYGESVIAMLGLAPTNPDRLYVATPSRVRRKLPHNLIVKYITGIEPSAHYDGIDCQSAYDAILACKSSMMSERLFFASEKARDEGYISDHQLEILNDELGVFVE